jgi:hypothetical protein
MLPSNTVIVTPSVTELSNLCLDLPELQSITTGVGSDPLAQGQLAVHYDVLAGLMGLWHHQALHDRPLQHAQDPVYPGPHLLALSVLPGLPPLTLHVRLVETSLV